MNLIVDYIIPFIIALGLLILVHELGHYLVARACGVKVLRFSIGFGRPLARWQPKPDGTEWVLSIIPLGGYVKMLGEVDDGELSEQETHQAFSRKPVGKRFAIVAAGPIFNLLLAVVLYWGLFVVGTEELQPYIAPTESAASPARDAGVRDGDLVLGVDGNDVRSWQDLRWALLKHAVDRDAATLAVRTAEGDTATRILDLNGFSLDSPEQEDLITRMGLQVKLPPIAPLVDTVESDGAAAHAGLRKLDVILAIDGKALASSTEVVKIVRASAGQTRMFTVRRGEDRLEIAVTPDEKKQADGAVVGYIGAGFDASALFANVRYTPGAALVRAGRFTWEMSALSLKSIGQLILGNISLKNVSGPLTIADLAGKSAQHGWAAFIGFLAFISISLGILNLLPIPVLDGGHLLYYAVEFVLRKPLSERVAETGQKIGLAFLLMLMAFALYNDINRLIS
ncbi:MAG: RIP metalloprotease RseP [Azoarcus sp.]|jgi:regulator of sigma E protease|nr:RIP metalloprotease RseP [Azoarcus sp.]